MDSNQIEITQIQAVANVQFTLLEYAVRALAIISTVYYFFFAFPHAASSVGETIAGLFSGGIFTYERGNTVKALQ